jgi:hypothetical protein
MPAQATGSSIQAGTTVTTPEAASMWTTSPAARRSLY